MEPCLQQHVQEFLVSEQQRLKNLDKNIAKKIITHAESNLMNFMKSKAKINCFRPRETNIHFHTTLTHSATQPQQLFDSKKLEEHIQK
jgi:hypothetical protein